MNLRTVEYQGRTYSHHQRHNLEMALINGGWGLSFGKGSAETLAVKLVHVVMVFYGTGPTIWKALCAAVEKLHEGGN